jgi:anti-anti-sigma regulatory factor
VRALIQGPGLLGVVVDCEGINFLDSQGSAALDAVRVLCEQADVDLRLARVKPGVRAVLERDGTVGRLGADHLHGNVHRAVEAHLAE